VNQRRGAAQHTTETGIDRRSDRHTFEGDTCCLPADTKVVELIFDGASLVLFESTLECDLGGKNAEVGGDLESPTPRKPSLLETASPTKCPEESPRPLPLSELWRGRFWREGRESSSLADGRRSEETTVGLIGRMSWDLRPGIIFGLLLEPVHGRDVKAPDVNPRSGCPLSANRAVGRWARYLCPSRRRCRLRRWVCRRRVDTP